LAEESEDDREKVPSRKRSHKAVLLRRGATRQHAPEKIEETEHLDKHTDNWPFEEDEEYPTKEADCPAQLVLTREKVERLLRADDEEEAA
jgi:hypothetical protein